MSATITIEGKVLGSKRRLFPDQFLPFPPAFEMAGGRSTLRDLITLIVRREVAAFRQRQEEGRLFHVLTQREIAQGVRQGKIDSGGRESVQEVNEEAAVATALQAFTDGYYYVFVDGRQEEELDGQIIITPSSTVTFIRLVALAGG